MIARLDLDGEFSVDQVPDVRRFTEKMLIELDADTRARVSVATHELFENAVKFSDNGRATLNVVIEHSPVRVSVMTSNPASDKHCRSIADLSARLARTPPMDLYVCLMKAPQQGGLGIGRVAAEADMQLTIEVMQNVVTVKARLGHS